MANYIVQTVSGVDALVSASSEQQAEKDWQLEVDRYMAEPMKLVRKPRPGEVREIAKVGTHDYR